MILLLYALGVARDSVAAWAAVLAALVGGGMLGGLAGLRKSGAERESIVAAATRQAIEVFESSIASLKADLVDAQDEARGLTEELARARKELQLLTRLRSELEAEVVVLRARVEQLEKSVNGK